MTSAELIAQLQAARDATPQVEVVFGAADWTQLQADAATLGLSDHDLSELLGPQRYQGMGFGVDLTKP